uniref:Uncharacterized protein n=1 Tax=viral metagenome TaxID=1070528 RepID=A0A6C0DY59_9ZZZZ
MIKSYTVPVYDTKKHTNTKDRIIFTTSYGIKFNNNIITNSHKKCLYCSKSNLIFNKVCLNCDMKL